MSWKVLKGTRSGTGIWDEKNVMICKIPDDLENKNEVSELIASAPSLKEENEKLREIQSELVKCLNMYILIVGNTGHLVDRENAKLAYDMTQTAINSTI